MEGAANDNSEKDLLEENFSRSDFVLAEIPAVLHMFILDHVCVCYVFVYLFFLLFVVAFFLLLVALLLHVPVTFGRSS